MLTEHETLACAEILWTYNNLASPPAPADLLIVMGTNDTGVALHAAAIDKIFNYPLIIVSGGVSHEIALHAGDYGGVEADILSGIMIEQGVDAQKIILENRACNTGDNIVLSKELWRATGKNARTGHLAHTPTMERRALATAQKQWPDVQWSVSSQKTSFAAYIEKLDRTRFINNLVGDTFRILSYPDKGFQTPQTMPVHVKTALSTLLDAGFRKRIPEGSRDILAR